MGKRKQPEKTPRRLMVAHTPSINLVDEIKASTELLRKQRKKENADLEYALVTSVESAEIKDINDEFTREYLISEQAKVAAATAIKRMRELGVPTEIPKTYKGEMCKDEKQMARIRENLKSKKDAIEKSEKMKKLRELKKMGKKIQEEVLRKRNKEKKEFLEQVKKKPVSELFDD
jgi:hypothetical protein